MGRENQLFDPLEISRIEFKRVSLGFDLVECLIQMAFGGDLQRILDFQEEQAIAEERQKERNDKKSQNQERTFDPLVKKKAGQSLSDLLTGGNHPGSMYKYSEIFKEKA